MKEPRFIPAQSLASHPIPKWEYHVHTSYTDGTSSVSECVAKALELGLERLIFTEHTEPWQAKKEGWFSNYADDIERMRDLHGDQIELIIGIEAPAIDFEGTLEMTKEMGDRAEFILGAAHRYPGLGKRRVQDLDPKEALDLEFRTLEALLANPKVEAIAHIGATCAKYCGPFPEELTRAIVRQASQTGKAIEINHAYHKPLPTYLSICIEENADIIPGSNAHRPDQIGSVYKALFDWQQNDHA